MKHAPALKRALTRRHALAEVLAWQDDPGSGLKPVERPAPNLESTMLPLRIDWRRSSPPPPGEYPVASRAFRYWTAAEALRRGADFWAGVVPAKTEWWIGGALPVALDDGVDLNANYDRYGLHFYHQRLGKATVYTGESPDVLCHELGHAVLDAVKPQLFHTASIEVAAFHEAFGDVSSILSALQLEPVRRALIDATGGRYQSSQVSRLAEQVGGAIRRLRPDAVDPDCLRNAVNSFTYQAPEQLPPWAPASHLSCEPHSFSRVFSAGFFEGLCLMAGDGSSRLTEERLHQVALDTAGLLIEGVRSSNVPSRIFADVAARMIASASTIDRRYPGLLHSAFLRRGILTASAPGGETRASAGLLTLSGRAFGLGEKPLIVQAAGGPGESHAFLRWLIERGRIEAPADLFPRLPVHPQTVKSHRLVELDGHLVLERILFDCGFHAAS